MTIDKFSVDKQAIPEAAGERKLRRGAGGPDAELHLDGEKDTLYDDGLDIEENSETLAGTRGTSPGIIKP